MFFALSLFSLLIVSPRSVRFISDYMEMDIPEKYNFLEEYPQCDFGPLIQECGSCYAYGPLKSISHRICAKENRRVLLSSQYIIGCDFLDSGCEGGCSRSVFYFFEQNGVPEESCHPWQGILDFNSSICSKCVDGSDVKLYKTKVGSTKLISDPEYIKKEIYINGPVAASVSISEEFTNYKRGVFTYQNGDIFQEKTHSVEIIGWNKENNIPYWVVLNQYGQQWGINGTIHIRMGQDDARIESFVYAADPNVE